MAGHSDILGNVNRTREAKRIVMQHARKPSGPLFVQRLYILKFLSMVGRSGQNMNEFTSKSKQARFIGNYPTISRFDLILTNHST